MEKSVDLFHETIRCVRTGTVSSALVDTVKVSYYGQKLPIRQLATTVKSGDCITIDPYDTQILGTIVNCLVEAGFKAYAYSKTRAMISVPPMTGEQKKEVIVHLKKLAEEAKISIRNIRKNYRQELTKEDQKEQDKKIQEVTDGFIALIDSVLNDKLKVL